MWMVKAKNDQSLPDIGSVISWSLNGWRVIYNQDLDQQKKYPKKWMSFVFDHEHT